MEHNFLHNYELVVSFIGATRDVHEKAIDIDRTQISTLWKVLPEILLISFSFFLF